MALGQFALESIQTGGRRTYCGGETKENSSERHTFSSHIFFFFKGDPHAQKTKQVKEVKGECGSFLGFSRLDGWMVAF